MKTFSLDYVVKSVMVSLDENNMRNYQKYLQFAIRGYRELNLTSSPAPKIVYLNMLPNKSVDLPSDYIKYVCIGIVRHGRILTLGLDDSIALGSQVSPCGDPLPIALNNFDLQFGAGGGLEVNGTVDLGFGFNWQFLDSFRNSQWVGGLYGVGGGFNGLGYYRIDEANNRIQFSSEVPSNQIVLEYISDGINPDGTAAVPTPAVECLINWVHWKRMEFKKGSSLGEIEYAKQRYITTFNQMRHYNLSFSVQEYLDSLRTNVHQAPKR